MKWMKIIKRALLGAILTLSLTQGKEMENLSFLEVNNVKIPVIYEISSLLPIGFIKLVINGGGSVNEPKVGIASFSADMLERGTKERGEYGFSDALESKAISLSVDNGMESLGFSLEFLKEQESYAIALLGELLASPNLTKEAFNRTKLSISGNLLAKESDFDYIAQANLNALAFKDTPLANPRLGTLKSIESITLSDVKAFVKRTIILENMTILIGGDLDLETTKAKLSKILGILPKGAKIPQHSFFPASTPSDIIARKPEAKQAFIYFIAPFHFDNYENSLHKSRVMSFIMGGSGFGSRIMEEIRVKRGLAYAVYFYHFVNNTTSYAFGYLQTNLSNRDAAIAAVREVVAKFIKDGATSDELSGAKAYILGSQALGDETLSQRLGKKYANFYRGLPLDYHHTLIEKINALSLDELNAYIKSHAEVNNLSFSVVVDK